MMVKKILSEIRQLKQATEVLEYSSDNLNEIVGSFKIKYNYSAKDLYLCGDIPKSNTFVFHRLKKILLKVLRGRFHPPTLACSNR
ncbi:hypothetical protein psyc5s11_11080 [Clostridium gelidum]|uniref:Uncharacterized protein n=1 Tax=Clostridium gelidum TaxID=704125 RepID=A0ABM7T2B4_9CLOT|nr:hypothetical protein [Clostridium gelidum]BCZ45041.1 hypothetical protein psyc5s11_11080 [Clostridium gelidum]